MKNSKALFPLLLCLLGLANSCKSPKPQMIAPTYKECESDYNSVSISTTTDTIRFELDSTSYNKIKIQNTFLDNNNMYIAFYDDISKSSNIYNVQTQKLIKKINIRKVLNLPLGEGPIRPYFINFDSIIVIHQKKLYLIDSAGKLLTSFGPKSYFEYRYNPALETFTPPIVRNGRYYLPNTINNKGKSLSDLKDWDIFSIYNLADKKIDASYQLPVTYTTKHYGRDFFDYSLCINDKGNIVLSFPADPLIYETDLDSLHFSYNARSAAQQGDITPVPEDSLNDQRSARREYQRRPKYGAIFYDSYNKRYLRLTKTAVDTLPGGERTIHQKLIILDQQFKIIGESELPETVQLKTIFVGPDSTLYARVDVRDEYGINFIKLTYINNNILTKK